MAVPGLIARAAMRENSMKYGVFARDPLTSKDEEGRVPQPTAAAPQGFAEHSTGR
jgi:hypothetical protein